MLHKCANTSCSNPFRRLSEGKLFQVETEYFSPLELQKAHPSRNGRPMHRIEHYWLCNECSSFLTLTFEKGRGMITIAPQGRKQFEHWALTTWMLESRKRQS